MFGCEHKSVENQIWGNAMERLDEILQNLCESLDEQQFAMVMKFIGDVSNSAQELRELAEVNTIIVLFALAAATFENDLDRLETRVD